MIAAPHVPPPRRPTRQELLEAMAVARRREAEVADRIRRRDLVRTALECVAWCAAGLFSMGWAFHTTDEFAGRVAFLVGVGAGNAGILFALLSAYRRGERRGDW
jgi:hypothetical protein